MTKSAVAVVEFCIGSAAPGVLNAKPLLLLAVKMERQNQKLRSLPPGAIAFMKKVAKRNILGEKPGPGGRQRLWKSPEQPTESKAETPFSQGSKQRLPSL